MDGTNHTNPLFNLTPLLLYTMSNTKQERPFVWTDELVMKFANELFIDKMADKETISEFKASHSIKEEDRGWDIMLGEKVYFEREWFGNKEWTQGTVTALTFGKSARVHYINPETKFTEVEEFTLDKLFLEPQKAPKKQLLSIDEAPENRCNVCGGEMVLIRGRYPKEDKRYTCPTCVTERLEQINEISSNHYGKACKVTN